MFNTVDKLLKKYSIFNLYVYNKYIIFMIVYKHLISITHNHDQINNLNGGSQVRLKIIIPNLFL